MRMLPGKFWDASDTKLCIPKFSWILKRPILLFLVPVSNGAAGAASGRSRFCSELLGSLQICQTYATQRIWIQGPHVHCVCRSAMGRWNNACPDWRNEYILIVTLNNNNFVRNIPFVTARSFPFRDRKVNIPLGTVRYVI